MSGTPQPPAYLDAVESILKLFFPQFFDESSPDYVPPDILAQLELISDTSRPWCIPEDQQNLAQAYFIAYLVSLRNDTSSGKVDTPVAGPVISEKEGDISITYATDTGAATTMSKRPPSDPWDVWNRFWVRCGRGTITTRFGDPVKGGGLYTLEILPLALNVWRRIW